MSGWGGFWAGLFIMFGLAEIGARIGNAIIKAARIYKGWET